MGTLNGWPPPSYILMGRLYVERVEAQRVRDLRVPFKGLWQQSNWTLGQEPKFGSTIWHEIRVRGGGGGEPFGQEIVAGKSVPVRGAADGGALCEKICGGSLEQRLWTRVVFGQGHNPA